MNNHEYTIGLLLNDEEMRIKKKDTFNTNHIFDKDLIIIIKSLQEDEFSFHKLLMSHGKKIALLAIELANKAIKIKLMNEKKL